MSVSSASNLVTGQPAATGRERERAVEYRKVKRSTEHNMTVQNITEYIPCIFCYLYGYVLCILFVFGLLNTKYKIDQVSLQR